MRSFATKTLVWLAALFVPLQPLSLGMCCCASRQGNDAEARLAAVQDKACCCRSTPSDSSGTQTESPARFTDTPGEEVESCCTNQVCCCCKPDNSSPPDQQAPTGSPRRIVDELVQLLAPVSLGPSEIQLSAPVVSADQPVVDSGIERCIAHCRFNL